MEPILSSSLLMASIISSLTFCSSRTTSSKISCFILSKSNDSPSLVLPAGFALDKAEDFSEEFARSHGFFTGSAEFCGPEPREADEGEPLDSSF